MTEKAKSKMPPPPVINGKISWGLIQVMNLSTQEIVEYSGISPRTAVICAYAQKERKDYNTWDYETRYGHLVETGKYVYLIGDWSVFQDGRRIF